MAAALRRVLVANRGEIAVRIVRACHDEGCEAIVAVSDADRGFVGGLGWPTAWSQIGPPSPSASYLRVEQIIAAALLAGCDAVHPGYGFLSERPALAEAVRRSRARVHRAAGRRHPARRRQGRGPSCRERSGCADRRRFRRGSHARCRRRAVAHDRVPRTAQGGRRGRWAGHGARGRRAQLDERFDAASAEAEAGVRRRPLVRRALRGAGRGTSRSSCSADAARLRRPPRRARLLGPAAIPEAHRGGARSRAGAGAARADHCRRGLRSAVRSAT